MYPHHFTALLKDWLTAAHHPGIAKVQTCAEIGRWEQPVGVAITLSDGWRLVLQAVGTYPPGGSATENPDTPRPEPFPGMWQDRDDYQRARAADEAAARAYDGPKPRRPQATAPAVLAVVARVVEQASHPEVASVEQARRASDRPATVKVCCDDGSAVYLMAAGFMAPGTAEYSHPVHQVPRELV